LTPRAAPPVTSGGQPTPSRTTNRSLETNTGSSAGSHIDAKDADASQVRQRRVSVAVVLDFGLSHLGFFAVLSVLPLLLPQLNSAITAWWVGALLFMFNLARRASSLLFAGPIGRARVRNVMVVGLLGAAVGYGLIGVTHNVFVMAAGLLLAGVGISANGLAARAYVTVGLRTVSARAWAFGAIQIAVNVGAALGPVIGNLLLNQHRDAALLTAIGGCYIAAAAAVIALVPPAATASTGATREPLRWHKLLRALKDPAARQLCLLTILGGFLYAQFFSAVVLQVASATSSGALRAGVISSNAVVVVAAQYPVSRYCARASETHAARMRMIVAGVWLFVASMAVLAAAGRYVVFIYVAAAVLSVGETIYTPTVDSAFAELPGDRPAVERFNLRQISVAAGESAGSFVGGALFLLFAQHGARAMYWLVLTAIAAILLTILTITRRTWVTN
jgi:MFS family permease